MWWGRSASFSTAEGLDGGRAAVAIPSAGNGGGGGGGNGNGNGGGGGCSERSCATLRFEMCFSSSFAFRSLLDLV